MKFLIIENLRCFTDPGPVPLAPLTLLVGENSTGKTTFLAAVRLAWQLANDHTTPDFNEEPFRLGAFEQIANLPYRRAEQAESFRIGFETDTPQSLLRRSGGMLSKRVRLECTFVNRKSEPFLSKWTAFCKPYGIQITRLADKRSQMLKLSAPSGLPEIDVTQFGAFPLRFIGAHGFLAFLLAQAENRARGNLHGTVTVSAKDELLFSTLLKSLRSALPVQPYAFAPIRSEPKRTYEMLKHTPRPSGSHVPMILAKTVGGPEWDRMKGAIERFGAASGLFEGVGVRRSSQRESASFEVLIKMKGPLFNLVDVGYGVSQALPIVVDMIQGKKGSMFLLQQPEVHLHPRAQAELGSLIGQLVKTDEKTFIVETHSDYLVDRVRMDVRDGGGLRAKDVSILYFQREKTGVEIHPMALDDQGNFKEVPEGYRWFFMDEQSRFLGIQ